MVLNATRDVRVSFEMAFLQFQSWNFAGMDNYLQDKLGATKIKVQQKKNSGIYLVDYTYQNCDHVLNQAFGFS